MNSGLRSVRSCLVSGLVLGLAACGGGGGSPAPAPDRSPDPVSLAAGDIANAVPGLQYVSPGVKVTGIDAGETIEVTVDGGEVAVNGGAFKTGPVSVKRSDLLQVRTIAPDAFEKSKTVTLVLGDAAPAKWTLATPASTLALDVTPKHLEFSWTAMQGADRFRLLENPDGASGYTDTGIEIAGDAGSAGMTIATHLIDWNNASYALEACRGESCVMLPGHEVGLEQAMSIAAIHYLKPEPASAEYDAETGNEHFASAIDTNNDGSVIVIGASGVDYFSKPGRVQIYSRVSNQLELEAVFYGALSGPNPCFGSAVALDSAGGRMVVGAPLEEVVNSTGAIVGHAGALYFLSKEGESWRETQRFDLPDTATFDRRLAERVAISADGNVAVASRGVFLDFFRWNSTEWVPDGYLGGLSSSPKSLLLSSDGRTVIAGLGSTVFVADLPVDASDWSDAPVTQTFTLPAAEPDDAIVSLAWNKAEDLLVVGAPAHDSATSEDLADNSLTSSGTVAVFEKVAGAWTFREAFKSPRPAEWGDFGAAVSMTDDGLTIMVGEPGESGINSGLDPVYEQDPDDSDMGAVHVFRWQSGKWEATRLVKAANSGLNDWDEFGSSIASNGDGTLMAVGAPGEASSAAGVNPSNSEDDSMENRGAAYVY